KEQSLLSTEAVLNQVWGKYVYLNVNNKQLEVIVDSTGQLPFFYYPFPDGSLLFSSDMEVLFKALGKKPDYNWEYMCSYLIYGNSSAIQTPFKNVFELPSACSLQITKEERVTAPFWNPLGSYKKQELQSKNAVNVLQNTLKPWIKPYKNICVSLSGGLDSSSLMYCLKELVTKDQKLTALNYFHSQVKSSNELVHARQVCKEVGIELIEVDASNSLPFDPTYKKHPLKPNKPFPGLVSLKWLDAVQDHIPLTDPFTFLSGHGSDHIFMRPPSKRSTADYFLEKGLKGYKTQLESVAHFYRDPLYVIFKENAESLWSHLRSQHPTKRDIAKPVDETPQWIQSAVHQSTSPEFIHPVYSNLPKKLLPGKYDQIDAVYEGLASIHMAMESQVDPTFYPFLYEPVVEFALSFPTYELFDKGYDRYPLRKSVSETFKTDTVWRRDKSQTTGLFQLGIKRNLGYILDLCLEGQFVKQGLIDRKGLQNTINLIGSGDIKHIWPFMHLASAELFLRYWEEKVL
ncbi:MAG: hypothetical protein H0X26_07995, partial [Alphaproteobacteria bacterium]|nr:hypothetical protein [Alphaproteobacteria bacterium]